MTLPNPNGTYKGGNLSENTLAILTIENANPNTGMYSGNYIWNDKTFMLEGNFYYSDPFGSDGPVTFRARAIFLHPNNQFFQHLLLDFSSTDRNYGLLQGISTIAQGHGAVAQFSLNLGRHN